jgi:dihydropteroate synthase
MEGLWQVSYEVPCPTVMLGSHRFDIRTRAVVVGVVDLAGDASSTSAAADAERFASAGADAIEVGCEVLPAPPSEAQELDQVGSAVSAIRARCEVPLIVGTSRAAVVRESLAAGAVAGHDTGGLTDPGYLSAVAEAGASVMATATPEAMGRRSGLDGGHDAVEALRCQLRELARRAEGAGIPPERVIVAVGSHGHEIESHVTHLDVLRGHDQLAAMGWPLVVTAAPPGFLDLIAGSTHGTREDAAHTLEVLGIALGGRLVRTRDVRGARRSVDVISAVLAARKPTDAEPMVPA